MRKLILKLLLSFSLITLNACADIHIRPVRYYNFSVENIDQEAIRDVSDARDVNSGHLFRVSAMSYPPDIGRTHGGIPMHITPVPEAVELQWTTDNGVRHHEIVQVKP